MPAAPVALPPALNTALRRLRAASLDACERSVESLNIAALSASTAYQREPFEAAYRTLQRGMGVFGPAFDAALDKRVTADWQPKPDVPAAPPATDWAALSLLEDREVDLEVSAERFGMAISHASEWELRELDGYLRALAAICRMDFRRNPLRPESIGFAVVNGVRALKAEPSVVKTLEGELARSWGATLSKLYAGVNADLRSQGIEPLGLTVRQTARTTPTGANASGESPVYEGMPTSHAAGAGRMPSGAAPQGGSTGRQAGVAWNGDGHALAGATTVRADPVLTGVFRRLVRRSAASASSARGEGGWMSTIAEFVDHAGSPAIQNLIFEHREELRNATQRPTDRLIIDIVGNLFEQILSDPKVPPQIARQLARLQLPVLRAAMADPSFFASRRHPVRRLVNRIASLGIALDDLSSETGQALLDEVTKLVHELAEGEFDQIPAYEAKVQALEAFVVEQGRAAIDSRGEWTRLLAEREIELRTHQMQARRLHSELKDLAAPDFIREFIADVWSRVLLRACGAPDADGNAAQRMKTAGRDLFMSVQPKATADQRQQFIAQLPKLMQELNRGMDLIGWPEQARRALFAQLLPEHAKALRGDGMGTLEFNLLSRQIEQIIERAAATDARSQAAAPTEGTSLDTGTGPIFTPAEAQSLGLVTEEAIDWANKPQAVAATEETPPSVDDLAIRGLPRPEEPEPTRGPALADHVQIGLAYLMHLEGDWHKVRLTHVSPGRTFFVFIRGTRHEQAISLTRRMLVKLCDNDRLRAFESGFALERATVRARDRLAALEPA